MKRSHALMLRAMIEKASASLPDEDAVDAVELFPMWQPDTEYTRKESEELRVRDPEDNLLYKLIPLTHRSQSDWPPHLTPAIWQKVAKPGQGDTPDDPIPWVWGLALEKDKYYEDKDVIYVCTRDSLVGIYADLSALVGNYVEVYQ